MPCASPCRRFDLERRRRRAPRKTEGTMKEPRCSPRRCLRRSPTAAVPGGAKTMRHSRTPTKKFSLPFEECVEPRRGLEVERRKDRHQVYPNTARRCAVVSPRAGDKTAASFLARAAHRAGAGRSPTAPRAIEVVLRREKRRRRLTKCLGDIGIARTPAARVRETAKPKAARDL